jgi:AcrR family transcriptional regulator
MRNGRAVTAEHPGQDRPVTDSPVTSPRAGGRPRSARAHEAILDAAADELIEHGFSGTSIERIAARAGVARTTVYRRWSSLPELCMAALEHLREPLPPPPDQSLAADLVFLLQALRHLLTATRMGQLVPQLAAEARLHPELSLTYWNDYLVRGSSPFAVVLRRGVDQALIRPDLDVELVIDLLTGPVFKRCLWQLETSDRDLTVIVDIVLAGLAPRA